MPDLDRDIMRLLPDAGAQADYVSTPDLYERMQETVPDVPSIKTVLRRLAALEERGLVETDRRGTASVWRRKDGASGMAAKAGSIMSFDEALALQTLRRFSSRQIPGLVADSISALFKIADARLERPVSESERKYARWTGKVAVESGGFSLHYPPIDRKIFAAVSRALFEERKLRIVYRPRHNADNETPKILLPLGLVEVGGLVYMVGVSEGKPDPVLYRMDRLSRAEAMLESFDYPASFSLEVYVKQQRRFDFMVDKEVKLSLRFVNQAGDHLLEAPLSLDQTTRRSGDALFVQGTTMLSQRLRWWLRSFGPNVEVLGPASLRAELAAEAAALARIYGG
ncbi:MULTISPECIES: YafY family protein [unclassified Burkholderia]|uniref:helix-turn-helix transcriptional regulator n=1 Tax=unclassified Burkholderia TaxID=2613784 RepID=UPI000F56CC91|nr:MULTISPECIES: WYL domain-containing protein [unclassified Burkholderia]RQR46245.1 WYL domain-containing protein [Burkholderia sp. Bp9131]RQR78593.1 WYL domain-containing protein [Burkholderia sp. Bp9015]RQR81654.1 WYL domain-containing protein [Burkholderia sp. Bp9011]RQR91354.1 WYL domain-containing protein [Burkholderia sp. Bp9010]RQS40470.1 WYL domain-containing protein [Burkholderia sp. Bp8990]